MAARGLVDKFTTFSVKKSTTIKQFVAADFFVLLMYLYSIYQEDKTLAAKHVGFLSCSLTVLFFASPLILLVSLAKAFGDTLHYHPKLVDIIKNKFNIIDTSSPAYKMAQIPRKASLKFGLNPNTGEPSAYPYIALENVYFKTFITIESDNESDTGKAKRRFRELSPADIFVSYDRTPHVDCVTKYNDFLRNRARRSVYERTLEELRRLYRNPEYVSIRIDGGVESSIVVHLAHICRAQSRSGGKPQAIYFKQKEAALETEEFIKEMVDK
ncbi:hypothetical protein DMN91_012254 [Ooceraea biroi]|uniref:Uncharacterized protein n=1 Tax=Ooceraea biroi TaxID=2015173 RepID=A0A3L8D4D2_OOCBI|nr:hypothetical protein DMN91_012254 [Ooceraea biroi]